MAVAWNVFQLSHYQNEPDLHLLPVEMQFLGRFGSKRKPLFCNSMTSSMQGTEFIREEFTTEREKAVNNGCMPIPIAH